MSVCSSQRERFCFCLSLFLFVLWVCVMDGNTNGLLELLPLHIGKLTSLIYKADTGGGNTVHTGLKKQRAE